MTSAARCGTFRLAGRERDVRPGRGERIGDDPPQAPRAPGHQGHLAVEPKSVQNIAAHRVISPIGLLVVALLRSRQTIRTSMVRKEAGQEIAH